MKTKLSVLSLGLVLASTTVNAESQWSPVGLSDFFDNATDSWIAPPDGESAPRQGWLNTPDGFFTKEWHLSAAYKEDKQDTYTGVFQLQLPLTRRLWVGADMPFIVNKGNETDFGDMGLTVKTMFHETQNLSVSGGVGVRFPTGDEPTGGGAWGLHPHLSVWSDVGSGWSIRGGAGLEILPESSAKPTYTFAGNFSIGQTITPHNAALGDFTYYLASNIKVPLDSSTSMNTTVLPQTPGLRGQTGGNSLDDVVVSLTPGVRAHIANNTFLLLGVEVPVTGGDSFDYQVNLLLVKGF